MKALTDNSGDVRELDDEDFETMHTISDTLPAGLLQVIKQRGQRGPQQAPTKVKTTMRLSPEVLDHFKASGDGWQRRIDQALKEYIREHSA